MRRVHLIPGSTCQSLWHGGIHEKEISNLYRATLHWITTRIISLHLIKGTIFLLFSPSFVEMIWRRPFDICVHSLWHKKMTYNVLWIHFKIREGNKCDLCDPLKGRIYFLSQLSQLSLASESTGKGARSRFLMKSVRRYPLSLRCTEFVYFFSVLQYTNAPTHQRPNPITAKCTDIQS